MTLPQKSISVLTDTLNFTLKLEQLIGNGRLRTFDSSLAQEREKLRLKSLNLAEDDYGIRKRTVEYTDWLYKKANGYTPGKLFFPVLNYVELRNIDRLDEFFSEKGIQEVLARNKTVGDLLGKGYLHNFACASWAIGYSVPHRDGIVQFIDEMGRAHNLLS